MRKCVVGTITVIVGLSLFLFGVDLGITPIGNQGGISIAKSDKVWLVIVAGLIIGFLTSIAGPDLQILAKEMDAVTSGGISSQGILIFVSLEIQAMLTVGLLRILDSIFLKLRMVIVCLIIFGLSL